MATVRPILDTGMEAVTLDYFFTLDHVTSGEMPMMTDNMSSAGNVTGNTTKQAFYQFYQVSDKKD